MRSFTSPSGLTWTAGLVYLPASPMRGISPPRPGQEPEASGAILRFRTNGLALDLVDWPDDWVHLSDDDLTELLRRSQPALYALPPRGADGW